MLHWCLWAASSMTRWWNQFCALWRNWICPYKKWQRERRWDVVPSRWRHVLHDPFNFSHNSPPAPKWNPGYWHCPPPPRLQMMQLTSCPPLTPRLTCCPTRSKISPPSLTLSTSAGNGYETQRRSVSTAQTRHASPLFFHPSELLLNRHVQYFPSWVYPLSHELILHSIRNPLVSGFYKLLSVAMRVAKKIRYYQVRCSLLESDILQNSKCKCFISFFDRGLVWKRQPRVTQWRVLLLHSTPSLAKRWALFGRLLRVRSFLMKMRKAVTDAVLLVGVREDEAVQGRAAGLLFDLRPLIAPQHYSPGHQGLLSCTWGLGHGFFG